MRCKDKGKLCKSCSNYNTNSRRCSKEHWLDMIDIVKGTKPTKNLWKSRWR